MTRPKAERDSRFSSKLTPEVAARVRADHAGGVPMSEIAKRLGVNRSSVSAILSGRTYKVVPEPTP